MSHDRKKMPMKNLFHTYLYFPVTSDGSARKEESIQEGDTEEPLRFESLEVISLEQSVPDHLIKSYDEVKTFFNQIFSLS